MYSIKMSTMTGFSWMLLVFATTTFTSADRMHRIEQNIKNIDLKIHAYSNDILTLKHDVADTNKKLDLILEMMHGSTTVHHASHNIDTSTGNTRTSDHVSTLHELETTVKEEIRRVRRAFISEKNKLSKQQNINTDQFLKFSAKLNDTLTTLYDRRDTKWTLAADSINTSVVSVLGTVRADIDNQLVLWNQSIHDNLKAQTRTTLASLNVLNQDVDSWNVSIYQSLHQVDNTVSNFINQSWIQHDKFTNTLQTELKSSLTEIKDSVRSLDYTDTLSNIVDTLQSQATKVDKIVYDIHTHGATRLVHSTYTSKGRLEVYINGRWGTVCDDKFSNTDATVVCKQLGYSKGIYKDGAYFGQGTLPIVMDNVECTGRELSIQACPYDKDTSDCSHSEDVGVICSY